MPLDPKYALTPYWRKILEFHLNCASALNKCHNKTWQYGDFHLVPIFHFLDEKVTFEINFNEKDPRRLKLQQDYKPVLEAEITPALKSFPSFIEELPQSFTLAICISPAGPAYPLWTDISLRLRHYGENIRWNIEKIAKSDWEEITSLELPDAYGIYTVSVDCSNLSAHSEITKSTGNQHVDNKVRELLCQYCFPKKWCEDRQSEKFLPDKFQVAMAFSNSGFGLQTHIVDSRDAIPLISELQNQIPLRLPRPPEDLSQYETSLLKLRRHCEDNPSDQETCLRYAALMVQYAQKAKVNPTAKFPWQDSAKTSIQICRTTLERFPDSAQAHFQLAYCLGLYAELFHTVPFHIEEIAREYKTARSLDQTGIWLANRHLVNLYTTIGRYAEAIAELESDPRRDDDVLYTLATLKHKLGDYHGALKTVKELETFIEQEEFYFSQQNALNELKATIEEELKK